MQIWSANTVKRGSSFGSAIQSRSYASGAYRYGFNGKELDKDEEGMGGGGSTYDYGFRIYNAQLGRFLSIDPLFRSYPWYTTFQFAGNRPIQSIDIDGLEDKPTTGESPDKKESPATKEGTIKIDPVYNKGNGWTTATVLENARKSSRIQQQENLLKKQGVDITITVANVTATAHPVIYLKSNSDVNTAVLGYAWEIMNAINDSRFKKLETQAKSSGVDANPLSRDAFINGKLAIEVDAMINEYLVALELGLTPRVNLGAMGYTKEYIIKNYALVSKKLVTKMRTSGKNGLGETPEQAYGKQYDTLKKLGDDERKNEDKKSNSTGTGSTGSSSTETDSTGTGSTGASSTETDSTGTGNNEKR